MTVVTEGGRSPGERVDRWLALLAGPACWIDGGRSRPAAATASAALLAELLVGLPAAMAPFLRRRSSGPGVGLTATANATTPSVVASVAILVLLLPTTAAIVASLTGTPAALGPLGRLEVSGGLRAGALIIAAGGCTAALGRWTMLLSIPGGFMAGSEAFATGILIGTELDGADMWKRFVLSPVHLGMVAGGAVAALAGFAPIAALVLGTVELSAVAACLALGLWRLQAERDRLHVDAAVQHALRQEHQRHAARLHDDIVGRLRVLRARLEDRGDEVIDLRDHVADIEHELRVDQLDASVRSGTASVAELVQTYVRFAVNHGVTITEVPRFDDTDVVLEPDAGWLLKRVLAGTVSNAVTAGATALAVRIERRDDGLLAVEVEDDAGGFELTDAHVGRGLHRLREELGGHLSVNATDLGSRVRALVPIGTAR